MSRLHLNGIPPQAGIPRIHKVKSRRGGNSSRRAIKNNGDGVGRILGGCSPSAQLASLFSFFRYCRFRNEPTQGKKRSRQMIYSRAFHPSTYLRQKHMHINIYMQLWSGAKVIRVK